MKLSHRGQLLLPILGLFFIMLLAVIVVIRQGRSHVQRLRLELAADAVALSCARAQAQMLSGISALNAGGNAFYLKGKVPRVDDNIAVMKVNSVKAFTQWNALLKNLVRGYNAYVVTATVMTGRANGVKTLPLLPISSLLLPQNLHVAIVIYPIPPWVLYRNFENAYYARGWSPRRTQAQPAHKVICYVWNAKGHAVGAARVWLDVKSGNVLHNGGFPRPREAGLRSVGVQSFYPQFSARLMPRPSWPEALQLLAKARNPT